MLLLVSCAKESTKITKEDDKAIITTSKQGGIKKSAGVFIYGDPKKIEVIKRGKKRTVRPGDKCYEKLREAGECVILRVGDCTVEISSYEYDFTKTMNKSPAIVRLVYNKKPAFIFFKNQGHLKPDNDLADPKEFLEITFYSGKCS